ncbi:MAG: CoA-binding protein [Deltaproteobacteria bacterium]|nr:MAG: CoA-binding protein [Deltaproteobacteria bacterium]
MSKILKKFEPLFYPRSIALIGASQTPPKWGFGISFSIVTGGFRGNFYPINLREKEILGFKAYPSVTDVPDEIDLAIITLPPARVIDALRDCKKKRVKAAVVITAGYSEVGPEEKKLEEELIREIRKTNMVVIGPNCMGLMSLDINLNAFFSPATLPAGPLSLVTQSGNVGGSLTFFPELYNIGFNKIVSSGNEAAVFCEDIIEYFGEDPGTKVILAYIEGVDNGRRFFEVAKKVTRSKPIVVLKGGKTEAGEKACSSHTGALAGSDAIFDAACRQTGVIRAGDLDEMFLIAATFIGQPLPAGNRVGIITRGGGWGVLAADACASQGLDVVTLPDEVIREINEFLPSRWSHGNPVDLAAGGGEEGMLKCMEILIKSPRIDSLLQLGVGYGVLRKRMAKSAQGFPQYREMAKMVLKDAARKDRKHADTVLKLSSKYNKPIISYSPFSLSEKTSSTPVVRAFSKAGRIIYPTPLQAARALTFLVEYSRYLKESREVAK